MKNQKLLFFSSFLKNSYFRFSQKKSVLDSLGHKVPSIHTFNSHWCQTQFVKPLLSTHFLRETNKKSPVKPPNLLLVWAISSFRTNDG